VIVVSLLLFIGLLVAIMVVRRQRRELAQAEARRLDELEAQRAKFLTAQETERSHVEAMLDAMIEGLVVIDAERHIVLANRAAEGMFGFSRMMAGGTLLEATRNHEVAALAKRAITESAPIEHEIRLEHPKSCMLQVSAVALRQRSGERAGAVLVFHDITRLRQLEAVRQDFVANVSHELRTPLSLIKSAAETLLDGGKSDPVVTARFIEIIDRHASRLTLLIDELLLLARLDSGHLDLELLPVTLRSAVQESLDDAALLAQERRVTLSNEVPEGLLADADPGRLRQVLNNLIVNAIKYGRAEGLVAVGARRVPRGQVEISVQDDGPGIPLEAQPRIFERFYRVDKARSREQGGTGLGLAIVKNVVQAHGGEVRVDSAPGAGATFSFTLPMSNGQ
jgi:two-component system phosphate regulon sensor histidine kinase PhoR